MGDRDVIVLVDDEEEILDLLTVYLKNENFIVEVFTEGGNAIRYIEENGADLVILDVMLPDTDGFSVCRRLREKYFFPIIMLTAKNEDSDVLNGLTLGADDYITKPFNPVEVSARVKSQLRRYMQLGAGNLQQEVLRCGAIEVFDNEKKVMLDGEEVALTPTEYDILKLLMQHPGKVFSPKEIYRRIWNDQPYGSENTVAVHIRHLREKLEINPAEPRYLKVVWGQGYKCEKKDNCL